MAMEKKLAKRIEAFAALGSYMGKAAQDPDFRLLLERVQVQNPFFREREVLRAVSSWADLLDESGLEAFLRPYANRLPREKTIAVVMAGNIPLVGFHDYLCALLSGCRLQAKLSSKDALLLPFLHGKLRESAPEGSGLSQGDPDPVCFAKREVKGFDAVIATGNGNTFRYFDYYFGKYPHLLRKNRTSCAVLDGTESREELSGLADDIAAYFGLGCRSVSKLYVPASYDFIPLLDILAEKGKDLIDLASYKDNYDYHKSICLINGTAHYDTGAFLLVPSGSTASPMSMVYYEEYGDSARLESELENRRDELQCVVGHGRLAFGKAQSPGLGDYADGVDTMDFLCYPDA